MKYRLAEINVPKTAYAATDDEWRALPEGERIIHVFSVMSQAMPAPGSETGLWVLIEKVGGR
jgi:hypothetical protein